MELLSPLRKASLFLCLVNGLIMQAIPSGYAYGRQILIQGSKISGSTALANFPVLISFTLPELKHTSYGGHVSNLNGYDIVFTKSDCNTQLGLQIESYDPTTGKYVAWVKVASMTPGTNVNLHMYYGNASVSTNPSSTAVWSGFYGNWHFQGGSMTDNSGNGYTATNNGTTTQSPAYINDGRAASGTQWMQLTGFPDLTTSFSMSAWIYTTDNTYAGQRVFQDDENNTGGYALSLADPGTGSLRFYSRNSNPVSLDTPANIVANNTWYHAMAVVDMTAMMKYIYLNGTLVASGSYANAWGTDAGPASMGGETALGETANRFKGRLDEIQVAKTALSAGWAMTEYNNQSSPSTFYTISTEYTATILCVALPIELVDFNARNENDERAELTWSTATESNNDHFTIERSTSGDDWQPVTMVSGAGSSVQLLHYVAYDIAPLPGMAYYRLKQTDTDGTSSYSAPRSLEFGRVSGTDLVLYPNPASDLLQLQFPGMIGPVMTISDMQGRTLRRETIVGEHSSTVNIVDLPKGVYVVDLVDAGCTRSSRLVIEH